ncbi:hypothetical protein EON83_07465 [bacterium]|nr:MAG: hypothetical protein EON83_07465 [bacterium]
MAEFDATYGYSLERLLEVPFPEGPSDFAEFWRSTYEMARAVPLNIERRRIKSPHRDYELWEVEYDSLDRVRIGGWVALPVSGHFERGVVMGHGYGGRSEPAIELSGPPAVVISPCMRGFHRSARRDLPNNSGEHVVHGIESRDTYIHRGCAADLWLAASVLLELYPEAEGKLDYQGASFGGGIGALMLPWDERFRRAFLDVPSFGNHPLRVQLDCNGSGAAVRRRYLKDVSVLEVLAYFDAATAANQIRIPTFVAAALSDGSVPPPGQFAVYNAIGAEKELFVRQTGHPDSEADNRKLWWELGEWFNEA